MTHLSFSKISDYGLIGNARTAALVSNQGSIDWACFPHFDSPSTFAAILDRRRGGFFAIRPICHFESQQRYLEDTNVLETRFWTAQGEGRILDLFSVTSEAEKRRQLWPNHEILRIVEGIAGDIPFEMIYAPSPRYGKARIRLHLRRNFGITWELDKHFVLMRSTVTPQIRPGTEPSDLDEAFANFRIRGGESAQFSIIYDNEAPAVIPSLGDSARARLAETIRYWKGWVSQCTYSGLYHHQIKRSTLALKLLTFAPSGAIVAAPTCSLPERIHGKRNWDYRYCWLRDASFTVRALISLGFHDEAMAYASWLLSTTRLTRPRLQVLYTVYGEKNVPERTLDSLEGYAGSRPVRIGNDAHTQFQLDVYGEVLDAVYYLAPLINQWDRESRRFILDMGRYISRAWERPDEGIWEVRSQSAHHTHSKILAWVALDRIIRLARHYRWRAPLDEFRQTASRIREVVENRGYNERIQSYTRTLDGDELDASLLVLPLVGYCPANHLRMRSTRAAICRDLSKNSLIFRYREDVDDGVRGKEGSFGICNFWMAENLAKAGEVKEATHWFESLLQKDNELGLWSEEIDAVSFDFLGNYPQAFTHIGLINAAVALDEAVRRQKGEAA